MLNRVEAMLQGSEDREEYVEVLVRKVEETRYPSIAMLNRLDGLLAQLEQLERRGRQAAADRNGRQD